jgi:hypothetical protein
LPDDETGYLRRQRELSEAIQKAKLDCFVAALLAMTAERLVGS